MNTLRVGLLGASRVARYAMLEPAARLPGVEIAAVAARDPERARAYARAHGVARAEPSYDALLASPDLDLIYISTAPNAHAGQALAAIAAGKAVLVEKPFALNGEQARAVFEAGRAAGVGVFEAMHSPHHAMFARILEILASGEIGRPRKIDAMFGAPIDPDDALRWNPDLGGGALMDLGAYPLAWIRRMAGEDFIVVQAEREVRDGVDAFFQAKLAFPGDLEARIYGSMTIERATARLQVEGERGVLLALNPLAPQLGNALTIKIGKDQRSESVEGPSSYEAQLAAVRATLVDGAPFPFAADDFVRSMQAIDRIRAAFG